MKSGAEATLGVEVTLTTLANHLSAFSASGGCNNFKIENVEGKDFSVFKSPTQILSPGFSKGSGDE